MRHLRLRRLWEVLWHLWEFVIFMGVVTFMGQTEAVISSLINPLINDTVALFSFLCIAMKAEKSIVHLFCLLFFRKRGDDWYWSVCTAFFSFFFFPSHYSPCMMQSNESKRNSRASPLVNPEFFCFNDCSLPSPS